MLLYDVEIRPAMPSDDRKAPCDDRRLVYREIAGDAALHAAVTTLRSEPTRPHGHDFHEAMLVLEGDLLHLVNGEEERLAPGDLRVLGPADVHRFEARAARFANVALPAPFVAGFEALTGAAMSAVTPDPRPAFDAALAAHARGAGPLDAAAFLLALARGASPREPGPVWLVAARRALAGDADLRAGLAAMRAAAGTSDEHLSRVHSAVHGVPPSAFLARRRLARAAELLATTDLPVEAVGLRVGYASASHFHRAFRAAHGLAPGAMRRRAGRALAP